MKKVKQRQRIKQREKMIDRIKKMELDMEDGMMYSSGIRLEDDEEENDGNCEELARKKPRTPTNKNKCTSQTSRKEEGCKCGGCDHQRITSTKFPWKGISTKSVSENYARRREEMKTDANDPSEGTAVPSAIGTEELYTTLVIFWTNQNFAFVT
jgi:hypothetical protein